VLAGFVDEGGTGAGKLTDAQVDPEIETEIWLSEFA
jgi:hypothetical protein